MRDFKGMKRQRGRNRGGGGQGGGKQQHNVNRAFDSNGPDGVKIRGHAQHVYEKYQQLARDASASGDRVLAENYLQHAEHYFRVLRAVQPQRPVAEIIGRETFSGYDIDFEDESGAQAYAEAPAEALAEGGDGGGEGEQQHRGEYRQDREQRQDGQQREWRDRDRNRDQNQPRHENRDRDNNRPFDRDRDRPRNRDRDRSREDRPERDPAPAIEPDAAPLAAQASTPAPTGEEFSLRDQDGGFSPAPAFLQSRAPAPEAAEGEEKPKRQRRRRAPRAGFEGGDEGAPANQAEEA